MLWPLDPSSAHNQIQGHSQLLIKLQVLLGHIHLCLKKRKGSVYDLKSNSVIILQGKTPFYKDVSGRSHLTGFDSASLAPVVQILCKTFPIIFQCLAGEGVSKPR